MEVGQMDPIGHCVPGMAGDGGETGRSHLGLLLRDLV